MTEKREETDYLIIGKIARAFGIMGEVKVLPITDRIERFEGLDRVFLRDGSGYSARDVEHTRTAGAHVVLKLRGINDREGADQLRDQVLYIDRSHASRIDEGSHYYYDLLGCSVVTSEGEDVGTVADIRNFGSCDLYFVRGPDGREAMIPAVRDVIVSIDTREKTIVIRPVEGLLE